VSRLGTNTILTLQHLDSASVAALDYKAHRRDIARRSREKVKKRKQGEADIEQRKLVSAKRECSRVERSVAHLERKLAQQQSAQDSAVRTAVEREVRARMREVSLSTQDKLNAEREDKKKLQRENEQLLCELAGSRTMNARLNKKNEYLERQVPSPSKLISRRAESRRQRERTAREEAETTTEAALRSVQDEKILRLEQKHQADTRVDRAELDVAMLTEELEMQPYAMASAVVVDGENTVSYSPQKKPITASRAPLQWRFVSYIIKSLVSGVRPNSLNDQASDSYELFRAQYPALVAPRRPGTDWCLLAHLYLILSSSTSSTLLLFSPPVLSFPLLSSPL
jgi:hypothetical protein